MSRPLEDSAETQRGGVGVPPDLPTFIVIGAMKAGTTSLYQYLKNHDQIFMPRIKELDFFAAEGNWSRGLDWYRSQFKDGADAVARGEASTSYSQYPERDGVPERIARVLPHARLVYVVRDPVERIRSHYQHQVMTGMEKRPPELALLTDPTYLDCSRYAMQLERYLDHFPREQVLVVQSEALRSSRRATVQQVYGFLGVDPACVPDDVLGTEFYRTAHRRRYPAPVWWARRMAKRHAPHAGWAKELVDSVLYRRTVPDDEEGLAADVGDPLTPELRATLADALRDDVARLRRHLPPGFDGWGLG